ncbi:hypothetical protein Dimus_023296 [Dionaea muscipula]
MEMELVSGLASKMEMVGELVLICFDGALLFRREEGSMEMISSTMEMVGDGQEGADDGKEFDGDDLFDDGDGRRWATMGRSPELGLDVCCKLVC